ncbi:MAG: hypothetical protein IJ106_15965 [Parasporobacterium sp.]|nr:hypothetical protein [Parasporobacterium sp.]
MLTATKQSITGYWIEPLKKNIYSLEEINYFLYHHIDLVYREFFNEQLFDYIEKELQQPVMADDLRKIAERKGDTGEFVRYLLNESYYYNSRELAEISGLVAAIDTMGQAERFKIQGDSWYKSGQLESALRCYLEALKYRGTEDVGDAFYARVSYAIGTIYAMQFMCKSANTFFSYAYDLSPDPAFARACLYMSILAGDDEELLSSIVKYKVSDDYLDTIKERVAATRAEIEASDEMRDFSGNLEHSEYAEELLQLWKNKYYTMLK